MGWLVGAAEDPPKLVMATDSGDVVISLHKTLGESETNVTLTSSAKTHGYLRKQQKHDKLSKSSSSSSPSAPPGLPVLPGGQDPWLNYDPWSKTGPPRAQNTADDVPMHPRSMVDTVEERLTASVTERTEARFQKLEVDMAEIREQHQKHERWFQDAAVADQHLQQQVGSLSTQVTQQQQEVSSLSSDIKTGFQNIEALLSKRQRHDE